MGLISRVSSRTYRRSTVTTLEETLNFLCYILNKLHPNTNITTTNLLSLTTSDKISDTFHQNLKQIAIEIKGCHINKKHTTAELFTGIFYILFHRWLLYEKILDTFSLSNIIYNNRTSVKQLLFGKLSMLEIYHSDQSSNDFIQEVTNFYRDSKQLYNTYESKQKYTARNLKYFSNS